MYLSYHETICSTSPDSVDLKVNEVYSRYSHQDIKVAFTIGELK